ncbi:MAG: alpha/beta fold hydrolase [Verrucomicrobiota bacterium]
MKHLRASDLPPDVRLEYPYAGNLFEQPDGVMMHYLDEGSGPVVLMLHGNPTWSFYFRNLVDELVEAGFRCIVPDHVGCGLSDKPQEYDYTLERRIADVQGLMEHLGISSFSLVVHDWGGAIGCGLATRRPEALKKLVLLNTAAFVSKRIPLRIWLVKLPIIGQAIIRGINGFAGPAAIMSVEKPLSPSVKRGFLYPYRRWSERVAVWNFVKDIPMDESHPSFAQLAAIEAGLGLLKKKPVQMVWGGKDFCFNMHFLDRWREIFPEAECCLHEDAGHYILEDGGVEAIEQITAFLSQ